MTIPARFEAAVAEVRGTHEAFVRRFAKGPAPALNNRRYRALHGLMTALGLDRKTHPARVTLAELTDEQRAVLVALTDGPGIDLSSVAALPARWPMRRWLGLAPPGVLEALGIDRETSEETVSGRLETVALERRVEAYCEAWLANRNPESAAFFAGLREAAPWALGYARETLAKVRAPVFARVAMWAAFAASGATVPEGIDRQFPLAYRLPDEPLSEPCSTRFLREQFMAIDASRRDVVLSSILADRREHGTFEAAVYLIERCGPLPRATAAVERFVRRQRAKRLTPGEKRALSALAKRLKAISSGPARAPSPRMLAVVREFVAQDDGELTALQASQLVEAGRCWDHDALPAARRLSLDENDEAALGAVIAHLSLAEDGVVAFEAWLHGDAGAFFVAGTTDVVAVRDGGVTALEGTTDDEALLDALSAVGLSKAAVRSVQAVRAATTEAKRR